MEEDEKHHNFRKETVKEMAKLGMFGCIAPEKYGGIEVGALAAAVMTEKWPGSLLPGAFRSPPDDSIQSVLLSSGTEEQKQNLSQGLLTRTGSAALPSRKPTQVPTSPP